MTRRATVSKSQSKAEKKQKRESKSKKASSKKPTKKTVPPVKEEVVEEVVEEKVVVKKKRRVPTKESVELEFDDLIKTILEEIEKIRQNTPKAKGVRYLRTIGKKVKTLKSHSLRVMKQKHKTNRKNNTSSGFLKPVQLSAQMAKFGGWDPKELRSRVDVTKQICKYIKDNELQNPVDKRQIFPDKKLSKLLGYSPKKDSQPLTYYRIQTYMKTHFTNPPKKEEK